MQSFRTSNLQTSIMDILFGSRVSALNAVLLFKLLIIFQKQEYPFSRAAITKCRIQNDIIGINVFTILNTRNPRFRHLQSIPQYLTTRNVQYK